jgi:hypothetical protein
MATPNPTLIICSLSIIAILATGCPGPDDNDQCGPNGGDEVGDDECGETGEIGPLGPGECMHNEDPNIEGYRVQCEGEFHSKIDFHLALANMNCEEALGGEFCSQVHPFGPPFDSYEAPDVMACCGEVWDPAAYLDAYQDSCMHDLGAQACASIAIRLEKVIEDGGFKTDYGDYTKKGENLLAYIESHLLECATALYGGDTDPTPGELVSHWNVPNKNGPKGWWPAKDIVLSVEAGTSVVDAHRPEAQADWLGCHGVSDNDDEIFEDQTSPKGPIVVGVKLAGSVDGNLDGPGIGGSRVRSSMTFDTNCVDQGCPNASWSYASGRDPDFRMEELELYATNFELSSSTAALTIERARVELWTQAPGTKIFAADGSVLGYEVPAGQAWFYVAGMANGVYGRFMAVNSTDIEISADRGLWAIGSFDIESVDGADRTWTLTLDDSRWQR